MKPIKWTPKKVKVKDLVENPNNPKKLNEKGRGRLHTLLGKFGLAGTLIVNKDMTIIDGHSRKKELVADGVTEVWASMPNRLLTDKEYNELNALFDIAKASDVDMVLVEEVLDEDVLEEYHLSDDPEAAPRRDRTGNSVARYQISVQCADESQQDRLFTELVMRGYTCRSATR